MEKDEGELIMESRITRSLEIWRIAMLKKICSVAGREVFLG